MEKLKLINGNKQEMSKTLPKITILKQFNDVALAHIEENTGLKFVKGAWNTSEAQPVNSWQIAALFLTYNFKTQYHDNGTNKNTLFLKYCSNEGFKVDSICFECIEENNICLHDLKPSDRLAV